MHPNCRKAKENTMKSLLGLVRGLPTRGRKRKFEAKQKKKQLTLADHVGTGLPCSRGRNDGQNYFRRKGAKSNFKTTSPSRIQDGSEFLRRRMRTRVAATSSPTQREVTSTRLNQRHSFFCYQFIYLQVQFHSLLF